MHLSFLIVAGLLAALSISSASAAAAEGAGVRVAVAANFTDVGKELGRRFEKATGQRVRLSFGATGQLYAQISQGAPFEVFLAADQTRAARAVAEGLAVPGSRFTYANGRLVLFSRDPQRVFGRATLHEQDFTRLAIANPRTAPYGAAAIEVLQALGVYEDLQARIVEGNNIAQAYQFVETGNAEVGFVALSQVVGHRDGSRWLVPAALHTVIAQDAVLLKPGADNATARAFLEFLKGAEARSVITAHGYGSGD